MPSNNETPTPAQPIFFRLDSDECTSDDVRNLRIPDAMIRKPSFPNLHRVSQTLFHGMRVAALDELQRTFQSDLRRSQQQMEMLGHEHKGVQLKLSLAAIRIQSLQEEACHRFGHKEASSLPRD